jgi:hypothetical protein
MPSRDVAMPSRDVAMLRLYIHFHVYVLLIAKRLYY